MSRRVRVLVGAVVVAILAIGVWLWATAGQETTDDAQIDAHVTPVAARVGGTVLQVPVAENQEVEAGAVLAEIDRRDFELELERRRAELADAEAAEIAARAGVPIYVDHGDEPSVVGSRRSRDSRRQRPGGRAGH